MSNENKIVEKIIADAQAVRDEILHTAQKKADLVCKKAKDQADKDMSEAMKLANAEAEKAKGKEISGAEMSARKRVLETKQICLNNTITQAKNMLASLEGRPYEEIIIAMLDKAQKGEEIIFSATDRVSLLDVVTEKGYVVSEETRDFSGGFIVKKGDIEYNYSFEAIMAIEKEEIEQIAAEILFA